MPHSKFSFFLFIFLLITAVTFVAQLEAEEVSNEQERAITQEFITAAQKFVELGEIDKAIEIYERIVKGTPENLESRAQLATLYTRTKQYEKAAQTYSKLLETDPENIKYQDALVNSLQTAGKHNEALEIAQTYVQTDPEVGVHYARLAKLYEAEGNEAAAIANYKKATVFEYGDKKIYLILAEHYFLNEDIAAAEKVLKNALTHTKSEWERNDIERQLVNLYRYHGNLAEKLQKAETEGTITFEMQKERARLLLTTGELEKSVDAFKKALKMINNPYERSKVTEELLKAYLKHGRTDSALAFYEAEVSKQSRLVTHVTSYSIYGITVRFIGDDARKVLINAYKDMGKLEELATVFEGKLEKDANNPAVIEMLAETYWEASNYQKAAETYDLLSKVEPANVRSFYFAAAAFQEINQPDMVKTVLNRADTALAASKFKGDTSFLGALATICIDSNMYDPAIKLADAAVTKEESKDDGWDLKYLYAILAKSYQDAKRYEEAYEVYQQLVKVSDGSYMQARAKTEMEKIAKEGKLFEKWIPEQLKKVEENPDDPERISKLAESYEATDKIKEAVVQYESLSALEPENSQWHKKLGELYQNLPLERRETGEVIEDTALTLDGNRSFVEIDNSETLNNITGQVTVSAWLKTINFPEDYAPIISKTDERDSNFKKRSFFLSLKDDRSIQFAASPDGESDASIFSSKGIIELNTWHHIAGVVDTENDIIKLFIDGIEAGSRDFKDVKSIYNSKLPLRIGWTQEEIDTHASFNGLIDEVRIWNIARTAIEISSDMNRQLNEEEPGLVGYWKFDEETEGRIFDTSRNKNDGIFIGNVKLEPYTRPVFESLRLNQLAKSTSAYRKAVELKPTSYQLYDLLAKSHIKSDRTSDAEKVYRQALDASLKQSEHDSAIRAIIELYADEGQENKRIAFLEEIRQKLAKMDDSAVLHELLGDLYKKAGDSEKAELAYDKWLQIRQKALNSAQSAYSYRNFADKLLDKGLYPETALNFAKRAFLKNTGSSYDYPATLGRACVANGLYDEALKHFKHALNLISDEHYADMFWEEIAEAIKNANDKERYVQMLEALTNAIPVGNSSSRANVYRTLAQFYSENNMPEKAENYLLKTGFIPETCWITLGPFDNKDNMGPYIAYIPEEITQIDTTAKYYGKDKLIRWQKVDDNKIDGMIWLGSDIDWTATYTWAIVSSPDERDITIRFDSDDQGIVWLNGKEVFRHDRMSGAQVDRYIVPVTLKQGENTILLKVCNAEVYTYFFMRLTDADGNPFKDLKFKNADELLNAPPPTKPIFHVNVNLGLAEYYSKNDMPDKAMEQIRQTGIIHENAWLVLGPFDNTVGIGYNTKYIPEGTMQIDLTAKYEGVNEQISWKKFTDAALNGFIDFGEDVNWRVSYAMATVTSPDEREVLFRFSSDDQSKIWLNGTEVFADANAQSAILDKNTIPVTLKTGKNTILVKVCNEEMSWGFYLRVTDVDGKPFEDLKINNVQDN
ncbi:hypothetical protein C6501_10670 [Candidatus Poribacteria bacterium]|nr:MAG: hypothetical protein C6501_10670 [Candidatus Poribacteria bacterium]